MVTTYSMVKFDHDFLPKHPIKSTSVLQIRNIYRILKLGSSSGSYDIFQKVFRRVKKHHNNPFSLSVWMNCYLIWNLESDFAIQIWQPCYWYDIIRRLIRIWFIWSIFLKFIKGSFCYNWRFSAPSPSL